MKSKTIRCGYVTWPPFFSKDVNTGKTSGFLNDYMEEFGRAFDLKIEWTEEVALSDVPAALNTGRIDAFCLPLGAVPSRAVNMNFSRVVAYFPFYAYVRKDDKRFDQDLLAINDPAVTLSTMEGEYTSILARTTYPKAKILEITSNQGSSTLFLNVANKKADVIFQDPGSFASYEAENPNILRKVGGLVGSIPVGFPLKLDDAKIQRLFDYGVMDLENRQITRRLLKKYKFIGGAEPILYATMPGYQTPTLQPVDAE
jgi:ABC-type amino acid transport substrate-binding protein